MVLLSVRTLRHFGPRDAAIPDARLSLTAGASALRPAPLTFGESFEPLIEGVPAA